MNRNEILNQFLLLGAALLKESSNGDIHFEEQQAIVAELLHWLVNKDLFYADKPQWETNSRW